MVLVATATDLTVHHIYCKPCKKYYILPIMHSSGRLGTLK